MERWRMQQEKDREEGKGPIIWQSVDGEPHLPHDRRPAVEVPEGQREQLPGQAHEANQAKCSHKYVCFLSDWCQHNCCSQEAREEGRVCRTCCSFDPSWRFCFSFDFSTFETTFPKMSYIQVETSQTWPVEEAPPALVQNRWNFIKLVKMAKISPQTQKTYIIL